MKNKTHFGFKNVNKDEKQSLVKEVFDSVSNKYDLMNDLMSGGIHRIWKKEFIKNLNPACINSFLDLAGGTGDIAFSFIEKSYKYDKNPKVIVCDINEKMLEIGKEKATNKGYIENIEFVCANGENLPFDDNSFDVCTISFGLRNITNIDKALSEIHRILKPNGLFLCLEFSKVVIPIFDKIYDAYSFGVIPKIGKYVAKDEKSYKYLVESIRKFPSQEILEEKISNIGFKNVSYKNLTGGIAAIHQARKGSL